MLLEEVPAPRSIGLRPTGADNTYRRWDYLRGALISGGLALLFFGASALAINQDSRLVEAVFFVAMVLALMSLVTGLIFVVQAMLGSSEPVSFAVSRDFVPVKFRETMRSILLAHWNPLRVPANDTRAYQRYLSLCYILGSYNYLPEDIASVLEQVEIRDALSPGSDPSSRLEAANQLLRLLQEKYYA